MTEGGPGVEVRKDVSVAGSAGLTLAGAGIGAVLSLTNEALAARFLGIDGYGSYGLAVTIARVCEIAALFGTPLAVLRFLPVHLGRSEMRLALGVILAGAVAPIILGGAFLLVGTIWHAWIATEIFHLPQVADYLAVLAFAVPFMALSDLLGNIARGFGRPLLYIVIRNLVPPVLSILTIAALFATGGPRIGAAYGYLFATATGATIGLFAIAGLVRKRIGLVRPALQLSQLYKFATPIAINLMIGTALVWIDMFVLAALSDARTVGIYRGCAQLVVSFDLIFNASAAAAAPIFAVFYSQKAHERMQETLVVVLRFAALLATPLLGLILVNSRDILGLLGPEFEAGHEALAILAVGFFIKALFGCGSIILVVSGKQILEMSNVAFAACLNFVLLVLSIPRFGLIGAAASSAVSLTVLSVLRAAELRYVLGLRIMDGILLRTGMVSASCAALVWAVSLALSAGPGTGVIHLLIRMAVMGIAMVAGLWIFCLRENDRSALIGALAGKRLRGVPADGKPSVKL